MVGNPRFVRRTPPTRALDHEFADPQVFTGGARVEAARASVPFVRLTFDREAACLAFRSLGRPPAILRRSPVWILRSEVDQIIRVHGTLFSGGIMFAADPGIFDGVIFWTRAREALLDGFARAGWPVEPTAG